MYGPRKQPPRSLVLLAFAATVWGCATDDLGVNPPPRRALPTPDVASEPPRTQNPTPKAPTSEDTVGKKALEKIGTTEPVPQRPSVFDPPPVLSERAADRPVPHATREPDRVMRIGAQRVITHRLLDRLSRDDAGTVVTRVDVPSVMRPGSRNYANPWAVGPHRDLDRRHVWSDGSRFEWALRAALTLRAPSTVRYRLTVPAGATLEFGLAAGSPTARPTPVTVSITVTQGDETQAVFERTVQTRPLHRMTQWSEESADLSGWAGEEVELTIAVRSAGRGVIAMLAEPVLLTDAATEAGRRDARRHTGLDVADNVLIVVIDAQRADTVGVVRTRAGIPSFAPRMDALASEGVELTAAHAVANQTRLSTFAFLASQPPTLGAFHKVRWNYTPAEKARFYGQDPPLLPRLLGRLGYRVAGVGNNLFVFGNLELGLDAGFDRFVDHRHNTRDTELITQTATTWLQEHADERFFLLVNYNAPHRPHSPPKEVMARHREALDGLPDGWSDRYAGEVAFTDEHVGRLLDTLTSLGLDRKTMVLVTSDHGEIMDPRHQCYSSNWKSKCLHHHGKTLYLEEQHVPWLLRLPGRIPAGRTLTRPTSHLDLAPTVLGLLGVHAPTTQLGRDLSGAVLGGPEPAEAPVLAEARLARSLIEGGYHYIRHDRRERMTFELDTLYDRSRSLEELYDLRRDPDEVNNLAFDSPPELARMRASLDAVTHRMALQRGGAAPEPAVDPGEVPVTAPLDPGAVDPPEVDPPEVDPRTVDPRTVDPRAVDPREVETTPGPRVSLLFHGGPSGARFGGVIRCDAGFVEWSAMNDRPWNETRRTSNGVLSVDVLQQADQPRAGIWFRAADADAPIDFELTLDGKPLDATRFYVGAWGLKLFDTPVRVSGAAEYRLAVSRAGGPSIGRDVLAGVFFWHEEGAPGGANTDADATTRVEGEDSLDAEVRGLMKEWGYTGQ